MAKDAGEQPPRSLRNVFIESYEKPIVGTELPPSRRSR
jgi:hypothetical protein